MLPDRFDIFFFFKKMLQRFNENRENKNEKNGSCVPFSENQLLKVK